ncbi:hypothetical protein Thivi_0469 [Thiocystis violascens DSM 198]|uniref:Uncharacterized protein n=1 Tax=Thiocystis violascens (strain ATCC 17096 / DSM 198 / 6111) TaxID=765911 RepID=I3Y6B2_THIV6|nr:hypothetical protein Thivi_0469 [Thiocystis violascens DSM 198]
MAAMLIPSKPSRRKPDPFFLLVVFVAIGMFATLGYQVAIYSVATDNPLATQTPRPAEVGG